MQRWVWISLQWNKDSKGQALWVHYKFLFSLLSPKKYPGMLRMHAVVEVGDIFVFAAQILMNSLLVWSPLALSTYLDY